MAAVEFEPLYNVYRGILNNNRKFQTGESARIGYQLDCAEYRTLREQYQLARIAGKGTDLERSVRLLKYLAPRLIHSPWYDNSVPCNGLALLEYSLNQPEHGINCLNKAKILEECCLALGIYARRVHILPYSPFDSDSHVVTEIYDWAQKKWCMLDPSTNGYLVDENGVILSVLEAREKMADAEFVTFRKATGRGTDLQKTARRNREQNTYYAKNLFRIQVDAVCGFGGEDVRLNLTPEHFSVRQWSIARANYRIMMAEEYARTESGFELEKHLQIFRKGLREAEAMQEPRAVSVQCLLEAPV